MLTKTEGEAARRIVRMYLKEKRSMASIGREEKLSRHAIRTALVAHGTRMRSRAEAARERYSKRRTLRKEKEIIRSYRDDKNSAMAVCRKHRIAYWTLKGILEKNGIRMRNKSEAMTERHKRNPSFWARASLEEAKNFYWRKVKPKWAKETGREEAPTAEWTRKNFHGMYKAVVLNKKYARQGIKTMTGFFRAVKDKPQPNRKTLKAMQKEKEIIRLYRDEKKPVSDIIRELRTSHKIVKRTLRKNKVRRRTKGESLKEHHKRNPSFWSRAGLNEAEKYYQNTVKPKWVKETGENRAPPAEWVKKNFYGMYKAINLRKKYEEQGVRSMTGFYAVLGERNVYGRKYNRWDEWKGKRLKDYISHYEKNIRPEWEKDGGKQGTAPDTRWLKTKGHGHFINAIVVGKRLKGNRIFTLMDFWKRLGLSSWPGEWSDRSLREFKIKVRRKVLPEWKKTGKSHAPTRKWMSKNFSSVCNVIGEKKYASQGIKTAADLWVSMGLKPLKKPEHRWKGKRAGDMIAYYQESIKLRWKGKTAPTSKWLDSHGHAGFRAFIKSGQLKEEGISTMNRFWKKIGLKPSNERNKLTEKQETEIATEHGRGTTMKKIAERYGVSQATIRNTLKKARSESALARLIKRILSGRKRQG